MITDAASRKRSATRTTERTQGPPELRCGGSRGSERVQGGEEGKELNKKKKRTKKEKKEVQRELREDEHINYME